MKYLLYFFLPVLVALFLAQSSYGAVQYEVVDLGTLGGQASHAFDINNNGQVVGSSDVTGGGHAFIWQNGKMTDLTPTGGNSGASAINEKGQIVGSIGSKPCIWTGESYTFLNMDGCSSASVLDINDNGQVAGSLRTADYANHAVLWTGNDISYLGTLCETDTSSGAYAVNNSGQVVGSSNGKGYGRPFIWQNGIMTLLGDPMSNNNCAYDINDSGQAVGRANIVAGDLNLYAFLWQNGTSINLGALGGHTTYYSYARAINNNGTVVGYSTWSGSAYHAFIWQNGVMTDLNALVTLPSGWELYQAYGINDHGQIVGEAMVNGVARAFLLNPVPEPSSMAVLVCGLGCLGSMVKLRKR